MSCDEREEKKMQKNRKHTFGKFEIFAIMALIATIMIVCLAGAAQPDEADKKEQTGERPETTQNRAETTAPEETRTPETTIADDHPREVTQFYENIVSTTYSTPWNNSDIDFYIIADAVENDFKAHDISEYERYGGAFPLCIQAYTKYVCDIYGVDYTLILAMIETESGYKYDALSSAGCVGFMQISEKWHKDRMSKCGVEDLRDPYGNIRVGVDFIAELLERYDGNVLKALAAYNMGAAGAYRNLWQYGIYEYTYTDKVLSKQAAIAEGLTK